MRFYYILNGLDDPIKSRNKKYLIGSYNYWGNLNDNFLKASADADAVTAALNNCSEVFTKCRKYEDEAVITIKSCHSDITELKLQVWLEKLY